MWIQKVTDSERESFRPFFMEYSIYMAGFWFEFSINQKRVDTM